MSYSQSGSNFNLSKGDDGYWLVGELNNGQGGNNQTQLHLERYVCNNDGQIGWTSGEEGIMGNFSQFAHDVRLDDGHILVVQYDQGEQQLDLDNRIGNEWGNFKYN